MRTDVKRSGSIGTRLASALRSCIPGAFVNPSRQDLVALYRLRYKMALDERKYESALIFLDKILEVDPSDAEARLWKCELYHRHLRDFGRAIEAYNRLIRYPGAADRDIARKARSGLTEIMELLS
jgi:tetratricopeptide (TPR) repeat protein